MLPFRCIWIGLAICSPCLLPAQALNPKSHREAVARAAEIFEKNGADLRSFRIKSEFLRDAFVVSLFPAPKDPNDGVLAKVPSTATVSFGYQGNWQPDFLFSYDKTDPMGYGKALASVMRYRQVKGGGHGWPVDSIFTIGTTKDGFTVEEIRVPLTPGAFTSYSLNKRFVISRVHGGK